MVNFHRYTTVGILEHLLNCDEADLHAAIVTELRRLKKPVCKACSGTGKSSRGGDCAPCDGTGVLKG